MQHHANNVDPVLMSTHYSYTNTDNKFIAIPYYVTKLMSINY